MSEMIVSKGQGSRLRALQAEKDEALREKQELVGKLVATERRIRVLDTATACIAEALTGDPETKLAVGPVTDVGCAVNWTDAEPETPEPAPKVADEA